MAIMELPIKHSYVPSWGTWEGVREIVQNGLDEQDQRNHKLEVLYDPRRETLTVRNIGADMGPNVLLLGESSKTEDSSLRGQFGEGLNLAMLALVRAGHSLYVTTPNESWTAQLGKSAVFNERVLMVQTRKRRTPGKDVTVLIGNLPEERWFEIRDRFLPLTEYVKIDGGYYGDLLPEPQHAGKIYVKGIFVMDWADTNFGFDLRNVQTDRDRNMISAWDLQYHIRYVISAAMKSGVEGVAAKIFDKFVAGDADVNGASADLGSQSFREEMARRFREKYGENAVPVATLSECRELEFMGLVGVITPQGLRNVLKTVLGGVEEARLKHKVQVSRTYSLSELSLVERDVLDDAVRRVSVACSKMMVGQHEPEEPLTARVAIVDFTLDDTAAVTQMSTGDIQIARRCLETRGEFLGCLIHEEAHARTKAGDGSIEHSLAIERMWSVLYQDLVDELSATYVMN